ncbi:type III secretion system chaperone [Rhizobium alvei]|uniref:Type III secretion system chaperone n=1 Tax=Rhizobium alvei TaxID=1132659 RepID=A0ABT8YT25_9HYPH|nr:type III secretion system chaperone [Rhizobium alvei]MDO6966488.1 type III secretion system chaperone [Rhizobium alvei]
MDNETIAAIIAESGPQDEGILSVVALEDSEGQWLIRFENYDVIVDNIPELGKLFFSILIDGPTADKEADAFRAMLAQNGLWRETGGVRIALAGNNGAIEISIDIPAALATSAIVARTAAGLGNVAASWSLILRGAVVADEPDAVNNHAMIRV